MSEVSLVSLGCAKNLLDSEEILNRLRLLGCRVQPDLQRAELVIVNTCAFIREATEESLDTVAQVARLKGRGPCRGVLVVGCLAERFARIVRARVPEVDAVLGIRDYGSLEAVVGSLLAGNGEGERPRDRIRLTPRHYAYLKISEGCDNRCGYCVIPSIRGPYRSRAEGDILREADALLASGVREINLVAQDTTFYGRDPTGRGLARLLRRLASLCGGAWIRLLYTHPAHLGEEVIEAVGEEPAICRYIDVPFQHCADRILDRMGRKIDRRGIEGLIERIRREVPGVSLRTALIVGLPGETEGEFRELLDFIRSHRFERLGVFRYSPEAGTAAAGFPDQVEEEVKEERFREAMLAQQDIAFEFNASLRGRPLTVLVDGPSEERPGLLAGRTEWDAPDVDGCVFLDGEGLRTGEFCEAEITGSREYDLVGRALP